MWLLPALSTIATLALRVFYRFRLAGPPVPRRGPVLLVANHPNALLDPGAVAAAAKRPVRFMAKAPLFEDWRVRWLVRAVGAIPVYRKSEGVSQMGKNEESFRAVFEALREGAAVGIFPEGTSHSEPALAPVKTGAARIALGAAVGAAFPIIPVGLSLRDKGRFRSRALVLTGAAVSWDDLAGRGAGDPAAVRELTRRIEEALRGVTVNLESWEDAPLVEVAEEIFLAEEGVRVGAEGRVAAMREVAAGLARVRSGEAPEALELVREVRRHARLLGALGIRPHQLVQPEPTEALGWTMRMAVLFLLTTPIALAGTAAFVIPYSVIRVIGSRARLGPDLRATYKLFAGIVFYLLWIALFAALAWWRMGVATAIAVAVGLPLLGVATLAITDWRRAAGGAVRRFLVRRQRRELVAELRARQSALGRRLAEMREALR